MCSHNLTVLLEAIDILTCVSLMQPQPQALSLSLFLSGRREKDTGCCWSRGSQNLGAPQPPKNTVRPERQEV